MVAKYLLLYVYTIISLERNILAITSNIQEDFRMQNEVIFENESQKDELRDATITHQEELALRNDIKSLNKRDADFCKSFLFDAKGKLVSNCHQQNKDGLFCSEKDCPFKPSYPGTPKVQHLLNQSTRNMDLLITWEQPEFGRNNLCGFQIWITSLSSILGTTCVRINSKNQLSYVQQNVMFNTMYNVTVVSLPSYDDVDRSGRYLIFKSPGECELYKDAKINVALPWRCTIAPSVKTSKCINGTVKATLETTENASFDRFEVMVVLGHRFSPVKHFMRFYSKEESIAVITGLQPGVKYVIYVFYVDKDNDTTHSIHSTFMCKGNVPTVKLLNCHKGNATVSWNDVRLRGVVYRVSTMMVDSSGSNPNALLVQAKSATIIGLQKNTRYIVKVDILLKRRKIVIGSLRPLQFTCGSSRILSVPLEVPSNKTMQLAIGLSIGLLILLIIIMIVVCRYTQVFPIRMHWRRLQARRIVDHRANVPIHDDGNEDERKKQVVIVYPNGCTCVSDFLFLLACCLHRQNCDVIFDLCCKNMIHHSGRGREGYLMHSSNNADYVIIAFSQETNEADQESFTILVNSFIKEILENKVNPGKFIPISLGDPNSIDQDIRKVTDAITFDDNIMDKLQTLLRRVLQIEKCSINKAVFNHVSVDSRVTKALRQCLNMIKDTNHSHCCNALCRKGVKKALKPSDSFFDLSPDPDIDSDIQLEEFLDQLQLKTTDSNHLSSFKV